MGVWIAAVYHWLSGGNVAMLSKIKIYKIFNPDISQLGIWPKETAQGSMVPDVCVRMLIEACLLLPKKGNIPYAYYKGIGK